MSAGSSGRAKLKSAFPALVAIAVEIVARVAGLLAARALGLGGGGGGSAEGEANPVSGNRVDVVVKVAGSALWQAMLAGRRDAGKDLGVEDGRLYFLHGWSEVVAEVFRPRRTDGMFPAPRHAAEVACP